MGVVEARAGAGDRAAMRELDASFGGKGEVVTMFFPQDEGTEYSSAHAVALQRDGKIVTVGEAGDRGSFRWALARYLPNGRLDASFGRGGRVKVSLGVDADDVALQRNGKIVVAGGSNYLLARFNRDGSLDRSFGDGGKVKNTAGDGNGVAIQPNRKILVPRGGFALTRYNPDGTLDTTFGDPSQNAGSADSTGERTGTAHADFGYDSQGALDLALQRDGKVVVTGDVSNSEFGEAGKIAVARFNPDGTLDPSFGDGGQVVLADEGAYCDLLAWACGVTVQRDGRIIIAGQHIAGGAYRFMLVRLRPDGTLDRSFSEDGIASLFSGTANDVAVLKDRRIVAAGTNFNDFALLVLRPNGRREPNYGRNGLATARFSRLQTAEAEAAHALAVQADDKVILVGRSESVRLNVGAADHDRFALARFKAP